MKNIRNRIIQIIFIDLIFHWNQAQKKLQETTNQWSSTNSSLQSPEEFLPQTFEDEEHAKNTRRTKIF